MVHQRGNSHQHSKTETSPPTSTGTTSEDVNNSNIDANGPQMIGFRKKCRDLLLPFVLDGPILVSRIQATRSHSKTKFMELVSITGTHAFLVALFPMWYFGFGYIEIGRQLLLLLASGIYVGNFFKDYLCLPRPMPPALKLSPYHTNEFGMPSTHSVTALNTVFYLILTLVPMRNNEFWYYTALLGGIVYTILISYSRLYLGMHCLADILGGLIIGVFLLSGWIFCGGFDAVEYFLFHGNYVPMIVILFCMFILFVHPEPVFHYCPCFEDSVCVVGAACGILCGGARYPIYMRAVDRTLSMCFARYILGMTALLSTRFFLKPILWRVFSWVFETFHPPARRHLVHLTQKAAKNRAREEGTSPLPSLVRIPSDSSLNPDNDSREQSNSVIYPVRYDVDIPTKFIVYTAMGWCGAEVMPRTFELLGML